MNSTSNSNKALVSFFAECIMCPDLFRMFLQQIKLFFPVEPHFKEIFHDEYHSLDGNADGCDEIPGDSISWEVSVDRYSMSVNTLCDTLSSILQDDNAERLRRFMLEAIKLPNAQKHFSPRPNSANRTNEYFNTQEFCNILRYVIDKYNLIDNCECCGKKMNFKALSKNILGYNNQNVFDPSRLVFVGQDMSEKTVSNMLSINGLKGSWAKDIERLANLIVRCRVSDDRLHFCIR